ncbi:histidine kinase [Streptomyces sp. NPDC046215]|uniref:Sensor histidine kinase n=1 Tax=Streptomyces stramineus TaxID=173861 RepID=A0ABN1BB44_9ACTN
MSDTAVERKHLQPPNRYAMLPWLFMVTGPALDVVHGRTALPWLAGAGILAFAVLYALTIFAGFDTARKDAFAPKAQLAALAVLTYALALGYGGDWVLFFPLLSLAAGTLLRGMRRRLGPPIFLLSVSAAVIALTRDAADDLMLVGYGTALSGLVAAALLSLFDAVGQLRDTREELARSAVERERLRFSRDLHDLLGHTMSVIVVKAEAVRRLAKRDVEAALGQAADIEAVGRQALTEIREAVTGYREGSLTTELERAGSLLEASAIEPVVTQTGPPLPPQTAALLGWVVREGVTNVVRHSGAARCRIDVRGETDQVRLEITDDGRGVGSAPAGTGTGGTGLTGLAERLAAAGGSLTTGPDGRRGFRLVAELPVDSGAEEDLRA